MPAKVYADLDWANAVVSSFGEHDNCLMRVQSKSNAKKSLYYSLLDGEERAYLTTYNIPTKAPAGISAEAFYKTVTGTIEVHSIKDIPIRRIMVVENIAVAREENKAFNGDVRTNSVPVWIPSPNPMNDVCDGCTLPNVYVTTTIQGSSPYNASMSSMYYSYGSADVRFTQTTPGQFGSGGAFAPGFFPFYEYGNVQSENPFSKKNPNYYGKYQTPTLKKYSTFTLWKLFDNKSLTSNNILTTFEIDNNGKLVEDHSQVIVTGYNAVDFKMDKQQYPDIIYGYTAGKINSFVFSIQGTWTLNKVTYHCIINVNASDVNTMTPKLTMYYRNDDDN